LQGDTDVAIPLGRSQKVFIVNAKPDALHPDLICCIAEYNVKDFIELYRAINVYADNRASSESGIPKTGGEMILAQCNCSNIVQ
jgi:hypothetical protein